MFYRIPNDFKCNKIIACLNPLSSKRLCLTKNIPSLILIELPNKVIEVLLISEKIRVEYIASKEQTSPEAGWNHQDENYWLIVWSGYGVIEYNNGDKVTLKQGNYLNIKAHEQHRVIETSADETTVWLALFN